jgi:alpha-tubulin suppressor-like RCC1 family protein
VCGAAACLPSIRFESAPTDGGPDSAFDGYVATDGAYDATADVAIDRDLPGETGADSPTDGDAGLDATPPSDAGPTLGVFANAQYRDFAAYAACAVRSGTLYCWGDNWCNSYGQLGWANENAATDAGTVPPAPVTTTAGSASSIAQLAMGAVHTCALFGSTVYCWGDNSNAEIGNPSDEGGPAEFPVLGLPGEVSAIAATTSNTCAITAIRGGGNVSNVYCWGLNGSGESGRPVAQVFVPTALPLTGDVDGGALGVIRDALTIAGGGAHQCAITSASKILCWGATNALQCGPTLGKGPCGGAGPHTCSPQPLEVPLPAGETPIALALGDSHSCALTAAGDVFCWGANYSNQLATTTKQICAFDTDAGIPCSGTPVKIPGLSGIKHIYAGGDDTCALNASQFAYCWGDNGLGQIGDGDTNPVTHPVELLDPTTLNPYTFEDMALGRYTACGRDLDGGVYCWGASIVGPYAETNPVLVF